jgi:hypothetical protein
MLSKRCSAKMPLPFKIRTLPGRENVYKKSCSTLLRVHTSASVAVRFFHSKGKVARNNAATLENTIYETEGTSLQR